MTMNEDLLKEKIKSSLVDDKLPCAVAHQVAKEMNVELKEVGRVADDMGIKITKCQLGIF